MSAYFKLLGERVLGAFAASFLAILSAGGFNLLNAPWQDALATAGMAALLALLGSVAGGAITSSNSPALTAKETEVAVEQRTSY